jgi:hypothetical protein
MGRTWPVCAHAGWVWVGFKWLTAHAAIDSPTLVSPSGRTVKKAIYVQILQGQNVRRKPSGRGRAVALTLGAFSDFSCCLQQCRDEGRGGLRHGGSLWLALALSLRGRRL